MARKILHIDLDAFFCAVEEKRDPSLAGKAFAVGGSPKARGVVASCSYAARMVGIHSAMPMARAVRLCPDLQIVHSHFKLYRQYSNQVMHHIRQLTPLVEQISIDEAFLDISDLPDDPAKIARELQSVIRVDPGLPCSLGVATNKLVAKIANDVGKARSPGPTPPNAITVVPKGSEATFLAPLPVRALWGVGPKTAQRLGEIGIQTIGDIAACPAAELVHIFGKHGADLASRAQGIDNRPLSTTHETKSISNEITFAHDSADIDFLTRNLRRLAARVGKRLRKAHFAGNTVKIKVRWPDFTTLTRQKTLRDPVDQDQVIFETAQQLFHQVWPPGKPVRLLGVGVSNLVQPARQLSFWDQASTRDRKLQQVLDDLQQRYGEHVVRRGRYKD